MRLAARRRVLLVEDEVLMAMLLEDMLRELGHEIAALSTRLDEARTATFDVALLDINLNGERSFPVADVVRSRGLPLVFATGYGRRALGAAYRDAPLLQKPFSLDELRRTLDALGDAVGG